MPMVPDNVNRQTKPTKLQLQAASKHREPCNQQPSPFHLQSSIDPAPPTPTTPSCCCVQSTDHPRTKACAARAPPSRLSIWAPVEPTQPTEAEHPVSTHLVNQARLSNECPHTLKASPYSLSWQGPLRKQKEGDRSQAPMVLPWSWSSECSDFKEYCLQYGWMTDCASRDPTEQPNANHHFNNSNNTTDAVTN